MFLIYKFYNKYLMYLGCDLDKIYIVYMKCKH